MRVWCSYLVAAIWLTFLTSFAQRAQLPSCTPDVLQLNNSHTNLTLQLNVDGSISFNYRHCRLVDLTLRRSDISRCLRGTHIVFLGDSLSRYQYLSLAYFLTYGMWLPSHPSSALWNRVMTIEREYGNNWHKFHSESSSLLTTLPFVDVISDLDSLSRGAHSIRSPIQQGESQNVVSYEMCDCFRDYTHGMTIFLENRSYRLVLNSEKVKKKELDEGFHERDVRLSYLQWFGDQHIAGHKSISFPSRDTSFLKHVDKVRSVVCPAANATFFPLSESCTRQRYTRGTFAAESVYDFPAYEPTGICNGFDLDPAKNQASADCQRYEKEILGSLGTTHLILNSGWWPPFSVANFGPNLLPKTIDGAHRYFDTGTPRWAKSSLRLPLVTWRETNHGKSGFVDGFSSEVSTVKDAEEKFPPHLFGSFRVGYLTKALFDVHVIAEKCQLLRKSDPYNIEIKQLESKLLSMFVLEDDWPATLEFDCTLVSSIYADRIHFLPFVYNEINKVMLQASCPLQRSP